VSFSWLGPAGESHSSSRVYSICNLKLRRLLDSSLLYLLLSGLGQEQVTEINKRSRELGATEDTAIFYDKTKVGDHHLENILKGKYKWVYMSPEKALHPDVMHCVWENVDFRSKGLLRLILFPNGK
jgi:hypothetical protein